MNVIGVDIGGTNVRAGVLRDGRLTSIERRVHRKSAYGQLADYDQVLSVIVDLISELSSSREPACIGVSISGVLSADRSRLASNANLQWFDAPIAADLTRRTGLPAVMENDGNCAAWGEYLLGAGRGKDPFVLFTLGTGVGGGTVISGELVRGSEGGAGELGHICVVAGGRECGCGGLGCVEQYASGRALLGEYARLVLPDGNGDAGEWAKPAAAVPPDRYQELQARFETALVAGEAPAVRALHAITRPLSVAIAQVVRIVDPALVALAGGVSTLGEPLVAALRRDIEAYPAVPSRKVRVPVVLGELGENAGLAGAALLAREEFAPTQRVPPVMSQPAPPATDPQTLESRSS